jgi:hypothetical protein|mmetsp:Transcript_1557/g.5877  ORF Transcript_1557/g.5877 Transcript_1557/m.5877 type:complete len:262 (+) Transcript_1557:433-1218(+)
MKFLEDVSLSALNAFLSAVNVGDYVVHGQLEAYSCKLAGIDKKLSKSLDQEVVTMMAGSPSALSVSPVGPLTDAGSRKTLIFLILTLNHMYPDYDFSALRGHHFTKENVSASFGGTSSLGESQPSTSAQSIVQVTRVKNEIDGFLLESARVYSATVGAGAEPLASELWRAIDQSIALVDCDVYTYKAVAEGDPFCDDGNLWSFNYFFYNRKLKRILYFSCRAVSKTADEESVYENSDDDLSRPARDDSFLAEGMEMDEDLY